MKKYETPTVEIVIFNEDIMAGTIISGIEDAEV